MGFGFELMVITLMLVINAVFAAYEMALASISRVKLGVLANMKKPGAAEAIYMKDRMEGSLAVVQVGITLVGAIAAAIGGAGVDEYLSPILKGRWGLSETTADALSLVFLVIPLSCLTIAFAELVPKTYAIKHQVKVCLFLSPFMKLLAFIAYPLIRALESLVKGILNFVDRGKMPKEFTDQHTSLHELTAAVSLARTSSLLGVRQEKIVLSAALLSQRSIKEIIIPVTEISMIPLESSLSQALIHAHNDMHTRFPVCSLVNDAQTIMGYINFKDIVAALKISPDDPSVKGIVRPIITVPGSSTIAQVLEQMIAEKLHIAMVAGTGTAMAGMVTLEDIIEELIGEIEDEYDRIPSYIHPYGSGWVVGGGITMLALSKALGQWPAISATEEKVRLADWVEQKTGKPLKGGEVIEANGYQVMIRKLRRKKLGEAIISQIRYS